MKKITTLLVSCLILASVAKAQYVNIPDSNFRKFLISQVPGCFNGVGQMDTTCSDILNTTFLIMHDSIRDLSGIQFFKNLNTLYCYNNLLTNLSSLPNSLTYLDCSSNKLTSLSNLPTSLQSLNCEYNQLTTLPALPVTLNYLECFSNQLTSLPALPFSLTFLDCSKNPLISLPKLPDSLKILYCENDQLNTLPSLPGSFQQLFCNNNLLTNLPSFPNSLQQLSCNNNLLVSLQALPTSLTNLSCGNNQLSNLPALPNSLTSLSCNNNLLLYLPILPASLQQLSCANNQLISLPTFPNALQSLSCSNNQLTSLPTLPDSLQLLSCYNNQLTNLPTLSVLLQVLDCYDNQLSNLPALPINLTHLSCYSNPNLICLPKLPTYLKELKLDSTKIHCIPNFVAISIYDSIGNVLKIPVCDSIYNPNNCTIYSHRSYVNIPDSNFGKYLITQIPSCLFRDSSNKYWMDTTCSGVLSIVNIGLSNYPVKDITGIQYLSNLQTLVCDSTLLETLPQLPGSVQEIWIENNPLNNITAPFPNSLYAIYIVNSQLTSLPNIPKKLSTLSILGTPDLHCLPDIPNNPGLNIFLDTISIHCLPGIYSGLNVTDSLNHPVNLPVCNATYNPNGCTVYGSNNYVNIPDSNFGKYLISQIPSCLYKDSSNKYWMDTTCSGVLNMDSINIDGSKKATAQKISDIKGIEYFKSLKYLIATQNTISSILALPISLEHIELLGNQISTLPTLPANLTYLECSMNNINALPALPINLKSLIVPYNPIASLPLLPKSLGLLGVWSTKIHCLPILPDSLTVLSIDSNISCLPNRPSGLIVYSESSPIVINRPVCSATNNTYGCTVNGLTNYVNIPDSNFGNYLIGQIPTCLYKDSSNKYWMDTTCSGVLNTQSLYINGLSIKDITGITYFKNLITLDCGKNFITYLPSLPNSLINLQCSNNLMTSITTLPDSLKALYCFSNPDLHCLPVLPNSLNSLYIDNSNIKCIPNLVIGLVIYDSAVHILNPPVCNTTNNPNSCTVYNNYVNIPDSNFGKFLITQIPTCLYKDSSNKYWMDTTCSGVLNMQTINCNNLNIKSIEGVEYFKSIFSISCDSNYLVTIPDIRRLYYLSSLSCKNNLLTTLPLITSYNMYEIDCSNNLISSLPTLPFNLVKINCNNNLLTNLPVFNFRLFEASFKNNLITNLIVPCNSLKNLYCDSNKITSVAFSIEFLLDSGLYTLSLSGNSNLTCLPHLPYIGTLNISGTNISCIPNISYTQCFPSNIPVCSKNYNPNNCTIFNNYVFIPDNNFAKYLINQIPSCLIKDTSNYYWMDTTCIGVKKMSNINLQNDSIKDLTGVEYFTNLKVLNCENNQITILYLFPNSLTEFYCSNNQISFLQNLPKTLSTIYCDNNLLTWLPTLPDSLTILSCSYNKLKSLPALPNSLLDLSCSNNHLTNLPSLPNTLRGLDFYNNQISSLPAVLPAYLKGLNCSKNLITNLPPLPDSLDELYCNKNPNLHCIPKIPDSLNILFLDSSNIHCIPNTNLWLTIKDSLYNTLNMPICNATNNPNGCTIYGSNNYVNIPDSNFGKYLISQIPSCMYKDSSNKYWMDTTCSGVLDSTYLDASNYYIKDLTGIQYFKSLKTFYCDNNLLTVFPAFPDSITFLSCSYNELDSIYNLPNSIQTLYCDNNSITNITNLPNKLNYFNCDNNLLISLPTLPTTLTSLSCNDNLLKSLPSLPNNLNHLSCGYNQLMILPTLDYTLNYLYCDNNQISSLPNLNNLLVYLICDYNKLISLPTLNDSLHYLYCDNNQLLSLPSLPDSIKLLSCVGNNNIHCLPKLPGSLKTLYIDSSSINCIPNSVSGLLIYDSVFNILNMPLCNPTSNANQCQVFPVVHGSVFTDDNSNGIKDSNEHYRPFVQLNLSNGTSVITNTNGVYLLNLTDTGSYTLTTVAPIGFKAVPASFNFTFNNNNASLTLPDIALQPLGLTDSLSIFVTPWTGANTKPASQVQYFVSYENVGYYYNIADTIKLTYDSSKLHFDSCSIPIIGQYGNTIIASVDSLFPGIYKYCWLFFSVKTSVVSGDSIPAYATVSSQYSTDTSFCQVNVLASYDPNNKEATPVLSPIQVANGTFIDYTIHFQNTGTDTAFNIVLADTLSPLLQSNILQVVATSHPCNITLKDSIIYFEFLKVNIPDSTTNQFRSNGFVHFKLKPVANAPTGSTIYNKASVYFDYNKPMVTNTAGTFITPYGLPVMMGNYTVSPAYSIDNNTLQSVVNNWNTVTEINTAYFNIQRSVDASNFITVGKVTAKGASSYSFNDQAPPPPKGGIMYYRLQIADKNGHISYSETKAIAIQPKKYPVSIYPNPAKNYLMIKGSDVAQINILDNTGRIVMSKTGLNTNTVENKLNINLATGIYIAQIIQTNGKKVNCQLIIDK